MHSNDITAAGAPLEADQTVRYQDRPLSGKHLDVRADAGSDIGLGHAMRCLALAQGWIDAGGTVRLISKAPPKTITDRWHAEGVEVVEPNDIRLSPPTQADWLVCDGPGINIGEARASLGGKFLIIDDDGGQARYPCDLLLNQNPCAEPALYAGKSDARLLLGPDHALIRRDIRTWRNWSRPIPPTARSLLITFGGSDPGHHTERALEALSFLPPEVSLNIRVLVGGGNPRAPALAEHSSRRSGIELIFDTKDMGELIRKSDIVLSAAGSTLWELAVLATPMVIGAAVSVEHAPARAITARHAAIDLGPLAQASPQAIADTLVELVRDQARRQTLSNAARAGVDGHGVDRVLDAMIQGLV